MPDTGLPWEIPYVDPTDLVRDYPQASEDLADQIALKLQDLDDDIAGAGGLVEVKSVLFTGTQTASVNAGDNLAVTNLSITHTLADASNRLILMAFFGAAASTAGNAPVGIAIADDGTLITIGDADGSRVRVTAGGSIEGGADNRNVTMPHISFVYSPGDVSAHTYTVRAINITSSTRTLYVNRSEADTNNANFSRTVSALTLMEVKV